MTLDTLCTAAGDVLIYDTFNAAAAASSAPAASLLFGDAGAGGGAWMTGPAVEGAAAAVEPVTAVPAVEGEREGERLQGRRKRRRRARSCKNREDAESQRMTHIAVERNRRRQMNEYLAVLRSLMPESYVHRSDQASIVGGAIDFVKELEQLLQSLEAKKRTLLAQQRHKPPKCDATPAPSTASTITSAAATSSGSGAAGEEAETAAFDAAGPPFARFFTYPQYVWRHPARDVGAGAGAEDDRAGAGAEDDRAGAGAADIEVNLVETHASVRVMAPRRPGQLLKMVAGMQSLRLTVLHLNVTTLDSLALYSLSVKVEEGCGLTTADDVAAAVRHVLCIIDAEAASQRLLAGGAAGPFS